MKKLIIASLFALLSLSQSVFASDYGCKVLLCLSNPAGPEAVSQCVPPIEQLWDDLRHHRGFPSCEMGGASSTNYGSNTWANSGYCAPSLVLLDSASPTDPSMASCNAQGAINVVIGGALNTRIWWGVGGGASTTLVETGSATSYDPTLSVTNAITAYEAAAASSSGFSSGP